MNDNNVNLRSRLIAIIARCQSDNPEKTVDDVMEVFGRENDGHGSASNRKDEEDKSETNRETWDSIRSQFSSQINTGDAVICKLFISEKQGGWIATEKIWVNEKNNAACGDFCYRYYFHNKAGNHWAWRIKYALFQEKHDGINIVPEAYLIKE